MSYAVVIASAVAVGAGGKPTVGVIVVLTNRSSESFA